MPEVDDNQYVPPELFDLGDVAEQTLGGKDQTSGDDLTYKRDGAIC